MAKFFSRARLGIGVLSFGSDNCNVEDRMLYRDRIFV